MLNYSPPLPPQLTPQIFKLSLPFEAPCLGGLKCTSLIAIRSMLSSSLRDVVSKSFLESLTVPSFLPVALIILAQHKKSCWDFYELIFFLAGWANFFNYNIYFVYFLNELQLCSKHSLGSFKTLLREKIEHTEKLSSNKSPYSHH